MDLSIPFGFIFWIIVFIVVIAKFSSNNTNRNSNVKQNDNLPNDRKILEEKPHKTEIIKQDKIINENIVFVDHNKLKYELKLKLDNSFGLINLTNDYNIHLISYGMLLQCFEWKYKRLKILFRDKYECQICNYKNLSNHIHHKYYVQDQLPWQIDESGLITLCYKCHKETHRTTEIPINKLIGDTLVRVSYSNHNCSRCGGIGYLPQYNHVENGICFKCNGNSLDPGVFNKLLNQIKTKFTPYDQEVERNKYIKYIENLSFEEIITSYPNVEKYKVQQNYLENESDDLPF